jgi:hypothetical protein
MGNGAPGASVRGYDFASRGIRRMKLTRLCMNFGDRHQQQPC